MAGGTSSTVVNVDSLDAALVAPDPVSHRTDIFALGPVATAGTDTASHDGDLILRDLDPSSLLPGRRSGGSARTP